MESEKPQMPLSAGILVVGSLFWETDDVRQAWRRDSLRMQEAVDVRARQYATGIFQRDGETPTRWYSRVPARQGRRRPFPVSTRFERQPISSRRRSICGPAERQDQRNGRINAGWGCVALLPNPHCDIAPEILNSWTARVARARPYGNIRQAPGEGVLVNERGLLQIAWPALIADDNPIPLDLLLATATQPDLTGDPPRYPTAAMIAERWRKDREDNVRYFRNNVQSGIRTFEDNAIQAALAQ